MKVSMSYLSKVRYDENKDVIFTLSFNLPFQPHFVVVLSVMSVIPHVRIFSETVHKLNWTR